MVVERSFSVSPYKYERADGVKRVRTAGPPSAAALHSCSEYLVCGIMLFWGIPEPQ